jgi:myo-inositol-1-phosphate synthase
MEGTTFGEVPLNVEAKLEVWDSPNSAGKKYIHADIKAFIKTVEIAMSIFIKYQTNGEQSQWKKWTKEIIEK